MANKKRPDLTILNPMRLHLLLTVGGLGDVIHCIPALDFIFKHHDYQKYIIHPPDYLVPLFKKLYPKRVVRPLSDAPDKVDGKTAGIISPQIQRQSSMRVHLTDFAFYMFADTLPTKPEQRNLRTLKPEVNIRHLNLPHKYICISPYYRNNLRQMPSETLDAVCAWAKSRGLTAVILGSSGQIFNRRSNIKTTGETEWSCSSHSNLLDLSNKTSILETLQILWGAKALVTMDSGLLHLCALSQTPVIAGFTSVDPSTRIPYRRGVLNPAIHAIIPDIGCQFCQSRICMVYNGQHEFDKCYIGDRACVAKMSADKFITALESALEKK